MGRIRTSKWSVLITFSFLYYSWILLLIKVNYVIWRIDAFELWSWRRLLRVPWTARRSNQSILKEISPDIHWKDWSLKLQYFGHLMWRTDSFEDPEAGKDGRREKGTTEDEMVGWHYQLNGHEFEQTPGVGDGQGSLACCSTWGSKVSDAIERLNWNHADSHLITAYCCQYFEWIIFAILWSSMGQIYQGWSDSKKYHWLCYSI